jgi:hypothetical protein
MALPGGMVVGGGGCAPCGAAFAATRLGRRDIKGALKGEQIWCTRVRVLLVFIIFLNYTSMFQKIINVIQ